MRIGCIQFDVKFGDKKTNFQTVERLIDKDRADLWVLPELFNTGYLFTKQEELDTLAEDIPHGETSRFLIDLAEKYNTTIVGGLAEKKSNLFYNAAVMVDGSGMIGHYRKIHLFKNEKTWFRPGDLPFQVWEVDHVKIGLMICFDWIFPEAARTLALKGAQIICHPSNLVLPYCQDAMVTRCIENRVFAVTANRIGLEDRGGVQLLFTGGSQIAAHNGDILFRAAKDKEEIAVVEIDPNLANNKYVTEENNLFDDRRPEMYL